ncbi:MAG: FixG Ig-like domain-containing protein [Porticoccaceae bacterium]
MINKTDEAQWFDLEVTGLEGAELSVDPRFWIEAGSVQEMPLRLSMGQDALDQRITGIEFVLSAEQNQDIQSRQDGPLSGRAINRHISKRTSGYTNATGSRRHNSMVPPILAVVSDRAACQRRLCLYRYGGDSFPVTHFNGGR